MARNKDLWQNPNTAAVVLTGDTNACAKWHVWATSKLRAMLASTPGTTSNVFTPVEGITVYIDTRPNRIEIVAGGGLAIAVDDDSKPVISTLVNRQSSYAAFNSVPFSAPAYDYNRAQQTRTDKLLFSSLPQFRAGGTRVANFMTPPDHWLSLGASRQVLANYPPPAAVGMPRQINPYLTVTEGSWNDGVADAISWVSMYGSTEYSTNYPANYQLYYRGWWGTLAISNADLLPLSPDFPNPRWGIYGISTVRLSVLNGYRTPLQQNTAYLGAIAVLCMSSVLAKGVTSWIPGGYHAVAGDMSTQVKVKFFFIAKNPTGGGAGAVQLYFDPVPFELPIATFTANGATDFNGALIPVNGEHLAQLTQLSGFTKDGRKFAMFSHGCLATDKVAIEEVSLAKDYTSFTRTVRWTSTMYGPWGSYSYGSAPYRAGDECYGVIADGNNFTALVNAVTNVQGGGGIFTSTETQYLLHITPNEVSRVYDFPAGTMPMYASVDQGFIWVTTFGWSYSADTNKFLRKETATNKWVEMQIPPELASSASLAAAAIGGNLDLSMYPNGTAESALQLRYCRGFTANNSLFCLLKGTFVAVFGRYYSAGVSSGGTNGLVLVYNINSQEYKLLPYNPGSVVYPVSSGHWAFFTRAAIVSTEKIK